MKIFPLPQIVVFLACLAFGRSLGVQHALSYAAPPPGQAARLTLPEKALPTELLLNQINFLVVKVDALESNPVRLEHLWWLLHKPGGSLNLVSIYPSLEGSLEQDTAFQSDFSLIPSAQGWQFSPEFEQLLVEEQVQFHGYMILDETAFQDLIQNDLAAAGDRSNPQLFPEYASVVISWHKFCQLAFESSWQDPINNPWVLASRPQHLSFGPSASRSLQIWQLVMQDTPARRCNFPMLDQTLTQQP